MNKVFNCAVLKKINKPLVVYKCKTRKLTRGQVLVKLNFSCICRSQLMEIDGSRGKDKWLPHALGHEGSGKVVKIGPGVKKVKKGDLVIISWIKSKGIDAASPKYQTLKNELINAGSVTTFSEYSVISENRLSKKPKFLSLKEAALFGCALPTGGGIVLNQIKPTKNSTILIIGVGGVGISSLITLLALKCKNIIIFDKSKQKINFLKRLFKLNQVYYGSAKKFKDNFFREFPDGVDYCIESAGHAKTIELGFSLLKNQGKIVFASHPDIKERIKMKPHDLIRGKKIYGSWGGNFKPDRDIIKLAKIIKRSRFDLNKLLSRPYKLKNINTLIKKFRSNNSFFRPLLKIS